MDKQIAKMTAMVQVYVCDGCWDASFLISVIVCYYMQFGILYYGFCGASL